jgi:NodT family efflux transporter outer membrane factor (OMF) lipoprotein
VEEQWIDANDPRVLAAPHRDNWWAVFNDPTLNALIVTAYRQNPNLKVACWRIQQARAQCGVAAGGIFPQTQSVTGSYQRNEVSRTLQNQVSSAPFFNTIGFGTAMAWELDFWGAYRRAIEAADSQLDASAAGYNNALVLLLADVATNYVQIRALDLRLEYARKNVKIQQDSLEIARQRFKAGATSELDVSEAIFTVEQTEARIPALEILRRQAANRLCTLLGTPPQETTELLCGKQPVPKAPPEVAVGIPADLLRQRPDVGQAERLVAAQSAKIGIATADLYPHISIVGTLGVDSSEFSELFDPRSVTGSIGPSFTWNILNYGRLANGVRVQDARLEELAFQYQSTVLNAYQETESALIGFLKSQQRLKSLTRSAKAGERSVELANIQCQEGAANFAANYHRLFTLERFLAQEEDQMAEALGDVPLYLIQLYKALGGGWQCKPDEAEQSSQQAPDAADQPLAPIPPK